MPVSFCRAPFRPSRFPYLQPPSQHHPQNLPRQPSPRLPPRVAKFPLQYMSSTTSVPDYVTAVTSVSAEDVAEKLASSIVTSKIAACVNTIPKVKSYYWWKGEVQHDAEVMLVIKTRATLIPRLKHLISTEHPYDLPELIVHPIIEGSPEFLHWISESTIDPAETS